MTASHDRLRFVLAPLAVAATVAAQNFQFQLPRPRVPESLCLTPEAIRGGLACGDISGDGLRDLVLSSSESLITMVQRLGGSFVTESPLSSIGAQQPGLRDLDGDGDLDLVMGPMSPQTPSFCSAHLRGPVSWSQLALPGDATGPLHGIDVGDIDNDGDPDILLAPESNAQGALIILRNQNATFTADATRFQASLPLRCWPRLLDFDRDGDLDVVGSYDTGGLVWLRQQGGSFLNVTSTMPSTRAPLHQHFLGDLTGDGITDILLLLTTGELDLLRGPDWRLQPSLETVDPASRIVLADLDGDGDLDVMCNRGEAGLDVLMAQNGALVRADGIENGILAAGAGDVDGNGTDNALVVPSDWPTTVLDVARGSGRTLDAALDIGLQPVHYFQGVPPAIGDFNGDGFTDVLYVPNQLDGLPVRLRLGKGDGSFEVHEFPNLQTWAGHPVVVDIERDGDLDLLARVLAPTTSVAAYRNDGTGNFTCEVTAATLVGNFSGSFSAGDIDGDGDVDFVARRSGGAQAFLAQGTSYVPGQQITAVDPFTTLLADVDTDGDLDLITALPTPTGSCFIFDNNGIGQLTASTQHTINLAPGSSDAIAGDIDGDGDTDVVAVGSTSSLRVLRNNGSGNFTTSTLSIAGGGSPSQLADLDEDGVIDLVANSQTSTPSARVFFGTSGGNFVERTTTRVEQTNAIPDITAVDVDDDGDIDLSIGGGGFLINRLRDLSVPTTPHLGSTVRIDIASGPGFSANGLAFVAYASARTARPLQVPGFAGFLHLDPAATVLAASTPTSSIGVSSVFLAVPPTPALAGLELWLQVAIAPLNGPPGFTNAVCEHILP